jgi:LPPG:FO 2-phospho-L-lactate transferase
MRVTTLAGGAGAAKFLQGLIRAMDPTEITVIGNTGDDSVVYGLHVSPDLDIVTYALAGIVDKVGWGIKGDTTHALDQMAAYGVDPWFTLKDRDIGTHLARTTWLAEGFSLTDITDRIRRALGVESRILPMSDHPVRTILITSSGVERQFQEYFVRFHHSEAVREIRFEGAAAAFPGNEVLESIARADRIIVCPSNPALSIGPILAIPGVRTALAALRERVFAVSPIVGGTALKGPGAELMPVLGAEASAYGVARIYHDFCSTLVIDRVDEPDAERIRALGVVPAVTDTVMRDPDDATRLADFVLQL